MRQVQKITETELEVMSVLWQADEPMKAGQLCNILCERLGCGPSSVKTLLARLCAKNAITRYKSEYSGIYLYTPVLSNREYGRETAVKIIQKVFGGNARELIAALVEDDQLTDDDMAELKTLWDNRKQGN